MAVPSTSRIIAFRAPSRLGTQLEQIAERDANSVSATIRRLIALGVRTEEDTEIHTIQRGSK